MVNPRLLNEAGYRYGLWTVIEKAGNQPNGRALWLCRCDCGTERAVPSTDLRSGKSASCGCARQATQIKVRAIKFFGKDEAGKNYGRWTVLCRDTTHKGSAAWWLCRCTCGNEKSVRGVLLRDGSSQSCGCLGHEHRMAAISRPPGEANLSDLISNSNDNYTQYYILKEKYEGWQNWYNGQQKIWQGLK